MSVAYGRVGDVGILVVERLPCLALDSARRSRLEHLFQTALADETRLLILRVRGAAKLGASDLQPVQEQRTGIPESILEGIRSVGKPVVAVVEVGALGLNLELALACHGRLASADTVLGFPNLRIGRLPSAPALRSAVSLAGAAASFELFAQTPITASKALNARFIDGLVDLTSRNGALIVAVDTLIRGGPPERVIPASPAEGLFSDQRKALARSYRGQCAPQKLVDAIEALAHSADDGAVERLVAECEEASMAEVLRHLALSEARSGDIEGLPDAVSERFVSRVAVIGSGTMGVGIAISCLDAGFNVTLLEASHSALQRGLKSLEKHYRGAVEKKRLSEQQAIGVLARLRTSLDFLDLADIDLVIEAVFEDLGVKQDVFRRVASVAKPGCILATNTSYLDVDAIAAVTDRPNDVVGMHFFSPANVMKLVEVIRAKATADDALLTTVALSRRLGKIPVLARVCHGFIGNRMLRQYNREVQLCLIEGGSPQQIDGAMQRWGMAMGPLAVGDLAGLDIGYKARQALDEQLRGDPRSYCIADALVEHGRLGRKSGAGYYRYEAGGSDRAPDPLVEDIISEQAVKHGVHRHEVSDEEIVERLILALINEGAKVLEEGIAQRSGDIDVVYCNGYGFPAYRGGPMCFADQLGLPHVLGRLEDLRVRHGEQWAPAQLIRTLAESGRTFASCQKL